MSTFHSDRCTATACASAGLTADDRRAVARAAHKRFASDYRSRHYPAAPLTDGEVYGLVVRGAEVVGSWVHLQPAERAELDAMAEEIGSR